VHQRARNAGVRFRLGHEAGVMSIDGIEWRTMKATEPACASALLSLPSWFRSAAGARGL